MPILINFLPILLFVLIYAGTGVYFSIQGVDKAFYQLSPTVAIMPSLMLGWVLYRGTTQERMNSLLDGIRHREIITMCIIFLLAGAFGAVTKAIGSVDATVNLILSLVPSRFLLVSIFIVAAFISTAIGSALGTIAALSPIVVGLSGQDALSLTYGIATILSGAMFGDNLSVVSDTTIAAVMSQGADFKEKLKINVFVAMIASALTLLVLLLIDGQHASIQAGEYSLRLVAPYFVLIALAVCGVNVFVVLILSLIFAGLMGEHYSVLRFTKDISDGFGSMYDIMVLSMMTGGLSGLANKGSLALAEQLANRLKNGNKKMAQLLIVKIVSLFDILLANNTIAIIFSGEMAKHIANKYHIPPHYSAAWLDIFSCVFQGILPYGAQILLASAVSGLSPLEIVMHVYYCYILGIVALLYIFFKRMPHVT